MIFPLNIVHIKLDRVVLIHRLEFSLGYNSFVLFSLLQFRFQPWQAAAKTRYGFELICVYFFSVCGWFSVGVCNLCCFVIRVSPFPTLTIVNSTERRLIGRRPVFFRHFFLLSLDYPCFNSAQHFLTLTSFAILFWFVKSPRVTFHFAQLTAYCFHFHCFNYTFFNLISLIITYLLIVSNGTILFLLLLCLSCSRSFSFHFHWSKLICTRVKKSLVKISFTQINKNRFGLRTLRQLSWKLCLKKS